MHSNHKKIYIESILSTFILIQYTITVLKQSTNIHDWNPDKAKYFITFKETKIYKDLNKKLLKQSVFPSITVT